MSKKKVLLRGVFINRDTNGEGVLKVGTTLIRVSTVMGILYNEMELIEGGGWREFGYAMGGTLLIAGSPIVALAPGGGWIAAGTMLGGGIAMIGNCKK